MNHTESSYCATGFITVEYCCRQVTRDCNNVLQSASAGNHEVLSQTTTHAEQADAGGLVEIIPNQQILTDINKYQQHVSTTDLKLWTAMDCYGLGRQVSIEDGETYDLLMASNTQLVARHWENSTNRST